MMMMRRISLAVLFLLFVTLSSHAQNIGAKTNLLYWATTTPNVGLEAAVGRKHTAQVFFGFNPWKQSGATSRAFATGFSSRSIATGSARASTDGSSACMPWAASLMPEE